MFIITVTDNNNYLSDMHLKVGDYSLKIHKSAYHLFSVFISNVFFSLMQTRKIFGEILSGNLKAERYLPSSLCCLVTHGITAKHQLTKVSIVQLLNSKVTPCSVHHDSLLPTMHSCDKFQIGDVRQRLISYITFSLFRNFISN